MLILAGCSSADEKINIIKGPGNANNSYMVGLNELCIGSVEAFIGENDDLLISNKSSKGYEFSRINVVSKENESIISMLVDDNYTLEVSSDGKRFICNDYLVDIYEKNSRILAPYNLVKEPRPAGFPIVPSYSFTMGNELIFTDPFYYTKKYYKDPVKKTTTGLEHKPQPISFVQLGDMKQKAYPYTFTDLKVPEISYLKDPILLLEDLKYVFTGYNKNTGESSLYVFDLFTKEFIQIDDAIKAYTLSPDGKLIAYIKKIGGSTPGNKLFVTTINGEDKKEILDLYNINGIVWSPNSTWIAYSGGEKSKNDIGIIKTDGSGHEQLTNGMNSTNKLAWSHSGSKLAFTTFESNTASNLKVYIITLNIPHIQITNKTSSADDEKKYISEQLLNVLKAETLKQLKDRTLIEKDK